MDVDAYGDPMLIVNLSVWESLETLRQFALQGSHLEAFRRRAE